MGQGPITLKEVAQPNAEDNPAAGSKFPMHVHSADGAKFKVVNTEDELATAISKGWQRVDADPPKRGKGK